MKKWLVLVVVVMVSLMPWVSWGQDATSPVFVFGPCSFVRCSAGFQNVIRDGKCECEKEFGACPICGAKGDKLGLITITHADSYFANWGWIPSMNLYACPKCHSLFWENSKKEE